MFLPREFYEANQASSACRLRFESTVETSTPPFLRRLSLSLPPNISQAISSQPIPMTPNRVAAVPQFREHLARPGWLLVERLVGLAAERRPPLEAPIDRVVFTVWTPRSCGRCGSRVVGARRADD